MTEDAAVIFCIGDVTPSPFSFFFPKQRTVVGKQRACLQLCTKIPFSITKPGNEPVKMSKPDWVGDDAEKLYLWGAAVGLNIRPELLAYEASTRGYVRQPQEGKDECALMIRLSRVDCHNDSSTFPFSFRSRNPFRLPFFHHTNSTCSRTRRRYECHYDETISILLSSFP